MADEKERGTNDGEQWSEGGMTFTVNSASDPRAPEGSYYLSVSDDETGEKSTAVYSPDGSFADVPANKEFDEPQE